MCVYTHARTRTRMRRRTRTFLAASTVLRPMASTYLASCWEWANSFNEISWELLPSMFPVEKLIHSRNPSMTPCTSAGNKGNKRACMQRRQHRVSFIQQASGLQPFPTHIAQSSHLCQELGRCCQQDWHQYLLPLGRWTIDTERNDLMNTSVCLYSPAMAWAKMATDNTYCTLELLFKICEFSNYRGGF